LTAEDVTGQHDRRSVQSLARMKTDHLDVVQFHASPSQQTLEEHGALDALLDLREAGKVRFIGMSGTLPHLTDHIEMGVFDVFQIPYSAVEREHEAAIATALRRVQALSFAAAQQRGRQPKGSRLGCNGNAGAGHISMTCSMA
jgi:aryl-alcohol dehydrogenase-like predicted oxidoreductase